MKKLIVSIIWLCATLVANVHGRSLDNKNPGSLSLSSNALTLTWVKDSVGWKLKTLNANGMNLPDAAGYYTVIYSPGEPLKGLLQLNQAGTAFDFYPSAGTSSSNGVDFKHKIAVADIEASWKIDPVYPSDIQVQIKLTAKKEGFYSIASPTISRISRQDLSWGMLPGNWYGREIQPDIQLSSIYSMGLPNIPIVGPERSTMTLCPLITTKSGFTLAVIPDPGTAADPWPYDDANRMVNKVSMSTMDRYYELTPVAYSPVLGGSGSKLKAGETASFSFRYSISQSDWFPVFRHAVEDIYHFSDLLKIQKQKVALTERIRLMQLHLKNDKTSLWNTWQIDGLEVGANGSKNADLGTMWMMASIDNDTTFKNHLPYVRNFKLAQQQLTPGFFQYLAMGEYGSKDGFVSEVGNWVEPLFTTYYTLIDMGNILLFRPEDKELKERLRLAADKLLSWQHADGSWDVAYDKVSHHLTYPQLKDLRPTWYGMLVAYRILGDIRYLRSAEKAADWFIKNGVEKGYYLGVCGDAQNRWDFGTAQSSQALLDLYDLTKKENYKEAAIEVARVYSTSIFTHPVLTTQTKLINGVKYQDWEINQTGLGVEHPQGTAGGAGPILITSYTGLFVRMFEITKDSLFLNMARAAARGRHAFMDPKSGQSVYYWDKISKLDDWVMFFPHQAYWQVGWITDYLLSEVHLRSEGKISFPRGFMTPKVGPHETYGFAPGTIFSKQAGLWMPVGLLKSDNANFEPIAAISKADQKLYLMILNQSTELQKGSILIDRDQLISGERVAFGTEKVLMGQHVTINPQGKVNISIPAWGLVVVSVNLK